MKKGLIFAGGVVTGIVLTFLFLFVVSAFYNSKSEDGRTYFEKPGEIIEEKAFTVFQTLDQSSALVFKKSDYLGTAYLITNDEGKYYYDNETIIVPENKVVKQIGIYKYMAKNEIEKTVPIIKIFDKSK